MSGFQVPPEQGGHASSGQEHLQTDSQYPIPVRIEYESRLEVAPDTTPELSSLSGAGHTFGLGHKPITTPNLPGQHQSDNTGSTYPEVYSRSDTTSRPWFKTRRVLWAVAILIILAIGLGAGLGVGLRSNGSSDGSNVGSDSDGENDGDTNPDDEPNCEGGLCGRVLSANHFQEELYVFGRSQDNQTVSFRKYSSDSTWEDWEDLGTTDSENLISAPTVQSWPLNSETWRLDVVVVGDRDNTVYSQWLSDKEDWSGWKGIGEDVGSTISACFVRRHRENGSYVDRLDVWSTESDSGKVFKALWLEYDDDYEDCLDDGVTSECGRYNPTGEWWAEPDLSPTRFQVATSCAHSYSEEERYHDVMYYSPDRKMLYHSNFSDEAGQWSEQNGWNGSWLGDPSLFWLNDNRKVGHFFGVQEDHKMYHLSYNEEKNFDELNDMGGRVYSVPGFDNPEDNVLDIVALGQNGNLWHQHRDGSGWRPEWEDLRVSAASSPFMKTDFDNKLWIVAVNEKGELVAWSREHDINPEWEGSLTEENLGGALSLGYWS